MSTSKKSWARAIWGMAAAVMISASAFASEGGIPWDKAPNRANDVVSLQNGAKLFVNYCLNCHSASFARFNRMTDLGLTEAQIKDNLVFTGVKVGDTMQASIDPKQAKDWFGGTPPDLSVIARSRAAIGMGSGADYLYTYLRTYYPDDTKATGWNNLAFPSVAMPHVLWQLQGIRQPEYQKVQEHGHEVERVVGWKQLTPGAMTSVEYDQAIGDLVVFMQWMGEPAQGTRLRVGVGVMLFLGVLIVFTWRLNAAYWKDVK